MSIKALVTLHVSVWVEILLKLGDLMQFCHAPRERVSWNIFTALVDILALVTLHVSVWVEIAPSVLNFV